MIKFKKTKRAKSRTNINKVDEIVNVLDQLINLIKKGDIFGVMIKLGQLSKDAKEIVDQCKRYL